MDNMELIKQFKEMAHTLRYTLLFPENLDLNLGTDQSIKRHYIYDIFTKVYLLCRNQILYLDYSGAPFSFFPWYDSGYNVPDDFSIEDIKKIITTPTSNKSGPYFDISFEGHWISLLFNHIIVSTYEKLRKIISINPKFTCYDSILTVMFCLNDLGILKEMPKTPSESERLIIGLDKMLSTKSAQFDLYNDGSFVHFNSQNTYQFLATSNNSEFKRKIKSLFSLFSDNSINPSSLYWNGARQKDEDIMLTIDNDSTMRLLFNHKKELIDLLKNSNKDHITKQKSKTWYDNYQAVANYFSEASSFQELSTRYSTSDLLDYNYTIESLLNLKTIDTLMRCIYEGKEIYKIDVFPFMSDLVKVLKLPNALSRHYIIVPAFRALWQTNTSKSDFLMQCHMLDDFVPIIPQSNSDTRVRFWLILWNHMIDYLSNLVFPVIESSYFYYLFQHTANSNNYDSETDFHKILQTMYMDITSYINNIDSKLLQPPNSTAFSGTSFCSDTSYDDVCNYLDCIDKAKGTPIPQFHSFLNLNRLSRDESIPSAIKNAYLSPYKMSLKNIIEKGLL